MKYLFIVLMCFTHHLSLQGQLLFQDNNTSVSINDTLPQITIKDFDRGKDPLVNVFKLVFKGMKAKKEYRFTMKGKLYTVLYRNKTYYFDGFETKQVGDMRNYLVGFAVKLHRTTSSSTY